MVYKIYIGLIPNCFSKKKKRLIPNNNFVGYIYIYIFE